MNTQQNQRTVLITGSGRNIGRAIALELAAYGCNIILNGSSNRTDCESVASEIDTIGSQALRQQNPTGRLGEPSDIARMVKYLAGDQAGFVNGQLMQVNGGVVV